MDEIIRRIRCFDCNADIRKKGKENETEIIITNEEVDMLKDGYVLHIDGIDDFQCNIRVGGEEETRVTHLIKIYDKFANEVLSGRKNFEVRKNDRDYRVGDNIIFNVIDSSGMFHIDHPLNQETYEITYILSGDEWGLQKGYVVFSISKKM